MHYGETKQKWILVYDEIIENKLFEVSLHFPYLNPYSKRRAKDEKSDQNQEDFDKFYFDLFFRKAREISDTFFQTRRATEEFCISVACYQNDLFHYSALDENFRDKKIESELQLYSNNDTVNQLSIFNNKALLLNKLFKKIFIYQ